MLTKRLLMFGGAIGLAAATRPWPSQSAQATEIFEVLVSMAAAAG